VSGRTRAIPCILYGAKSTEDVRGSLATQLSDCSAAIAREGGRAIVGEYRDEAVSAYHRSRGDGLEAAMRRAAGIAEGGSSIELWVQHSDRLARGDGRTARHLVEVALWASKADIVVRSVQDNETFGDLLYAVVMGQRNHEDSRRKGAAVSAGIRRAAQRGEYRGTAADGYRVVVDVDDRGHVVKRLAIDPVRQPLIELVFSLARQGDGYGVIARKVNELGWRTAPRRRDLRPRPFDPNNVWGILTNPKYAALSSVKGEILGAAEWPAYITPEEYFARMARPRPYRLPRTGLPQLGYLLRSVTRCSLCGAHMSATTSAPRTDGVRPRRYICRSHARGVCQARPVDADLADYVFVAHLARFLGARVDRETTGAGRARGAKDDDGALLPNPLGPAATALAEELRQSILGAFADGNQRAAAQFVDQLAEHRQRHESALRALDAAPTTDLPLVARGPAEWLAAFHAWVTTSSSGRAPLSEETRELNGMVKRWFTSVELEQTGGALKMTARSQGLPHGAAAARASVNISNWRLGMLHAGAGHGSRRPWSRAEVVEAMHQWVRAHGSPPLAQEWRNATAQHPHAHTVIRLFGGWFAALQHAQLDPPVGMNHGRWTNAAIADALRVWTEEHGRAPRLREWPNATASRPSHETITRHFGTWAAALENAEIAPAFGSCVPRSQPDASRPYGP
jgi:DNA invertase Pin-like site-specific DNA recombinase